MNAAWLVSQGQALRDEFLDGLSEGALAALPYLFEFWAHPHQLPPAGDWRSWVILGGRGAGKTRAGAEWVRGMVEGPLPCDPGRARRVALVGETIDQVRDVMIFGESGILAVSPPDRRPDWVSGRRMLVWPNGATAQAFSAHDPESLRGPQFDAAWVDELGKWRKGQEAWDMLQFALRLGEDPRQVVTTTPRNVAVLKDLLDAPSTVVTQAPTEANRAYLAQSFLQEVRERYAGSALGRQELDGVLVEEVEGALWTAAGIAQCRLRGAPPEFDRVIVAVDPAVSSGKRSDTCGIVVVGAVTSGPPQAWRAVVLEDASVRAAAPQVWAAAALAAAGRHGADKIVAEVNQGGDLVEVLLRQLDPLAPLKKVHARQGKSLRAEPVAALYHQGRVAHVPGLAELEDEMCRMTPQGYAGTRSPDRLDALVWALTEALVVPAMSRSGSPRIRSLTG